MTNRAMLRPTTTPPGTRVSAELSSGPQDGLGGEEAGSPGAGAWPSYGGLR